MNVITTNADFVKSYNDQSKKLTLFWLYNTGITIQAVTVYATDSNYRNGKVIPNADVTIFNKSADNSVGYQYQYKIPFDTDGQQQAYDFYYQIVATMSDKTEVVYNVHSYYKPDGNPGTEGDSTRPIKP